MKLLKRTSLLLLIIVSCTPSTLAAPRKGYRWASGAESGSKRQDYIGDTEKKYTPYNPNGFHERIMREKKQAALRAARKAAMDLENKRSAEITNMLKKGETTKAIGMLKHMDLEGSPNAAFWLARLYLGNSGVKVDHAEAFKWLTISTRKGNRQASIDLARMYVNGWSTPASNEKAIAVLEKAKTPDSQYLGSAQK